MGAITNNVTISHPHYRKVRPCAKSLSMLVCTAPECHKAVEILLNFNRRYRSMALQKTEGSKPPDSLPQGACRQANYLGGKRYRFSQKVLLYWPQNSNAQQQQENPPDLSLVLELQVKPGTGLTAYGKEMDR
jgi:hypothetical protein